MSTTNQITIADMQNAALDDTFFKEVVNSRLGGEVSGARILSAVNRLGESSDTLDGRLSKLGYIAPIAYAGSIVFAVDENRKTIERSGVIYAPIPSLLPFTTSGTWVADDEDKFLVTASVQSPELADETTTGSSLVGYRGRTVEETLDSSAMHYDSIASANAANLTGVDLVTTSGYFGGWAGTVKGPRGRAEYHRDGTSGTASTIYTNQNGFFDNQGNGYQLNTDKTLHVDMFGSDTADSTSALTGAIKTTSRLDWGVGPYTLTAPLDIKTDGFGGQAFWRGAPGRSTLQGDTDLLTNVEFTDLRDMSFKNLTTDHKHISFTPGVSIAGQFITNCAFAKGAYHLYKASGGLINTFIRDSDFRNASVYSRWYGGAGSVVNGYTESNCVTVFNEIGLHLEAGTAILLSGSTFEQNTLEGIEINMPINTGLGIMLDTVYFEQNGNNGTPEVGPPVGGEVGHISITAASGTGVFFTMQSCRNSGQVFAGSPVETSLSGGGRLEFFNNGVKEFFTDVINSNLIKVYYGQDPIRGDGFDGRYLKSTRLLIRDGTNVDTIKAELQDKFNGDTIAQTDNIGTGFSDTNFALSANGEVLTIKRAAIGGNHLTPMDILAASINENNSGTTNDGNARMNVNGNDIDVTIGDGTSAALVDLTEVQSSGYWILDFNYMVREWFE